MNDLQVFKYENKEVRTVIKDGEPWWVAKDVAEVLEYQWQPNLVGHVPDEWKGINRINTLGGMQDLLCLSEPGLYFFVNRSDKPKALPFQKWVAGEVLPAIRKTGTYTVPGREPPQPEKMPWNYYPFFRRPDSGTVFADLRKALHNNEITLDEFRLTILGRETVNSIKAVFNPSQHPAPAEKAYAGVARIIQQPRKPDPAVAEFANKWLEFTGREEDYITIKELQNLFLEKTGKMIMQNVFTRNIKRAMPEAVRKQKKIDDVPVLILCGVLFSGS